MKRKAIMAMLLLASMLGTSLVIPSQALGESTIQAKFSYKGDVFADAQVATFGSANGQGTVSFRAAYESTDKFLYVQFEVTAETTVNSDDYLTLFLDLNNEKSTIPDSNDWYFFLDRIGRIGDGQYVVGTGWTSTANYPLWVYSWLSTSTSWEVVMAIQITINDGQTLGIMVQQGDASLMRYVNYPSGSSINSPSTWDALVVSKRDSSISITSSASVFQLNDGLTLTATVTPLTSNGTVTLQYSKDGGDWVSLASGKPSNGIYSSVWAPTAKASSYSVRTVWGGDEAYRSSTSSVLIFNHLTVTSPYGSPIGDAWYLSGRQAEFSVTPSIVDHGNKTRRVFIGWSGDSTSKESSASLIIDSAKTVTANWKTQYYLTITSAYGSTTGAGWYDSGSTASFSVTTLVDHGNKTRRVFTSWTGDSTATTSEASVLINSPKTVTAGWKTQHYLTVDTKGGEASGEGWHDAGTTATVKATSPCKTLEEQSRLIFTGWSGDSNSTSTEIPLKMDKPSSLTANWKTQYYLKIDAGPGVVDKSSAWFDSGSSITVAATSPSKVVADKSRLVFKGWSGAVTSTDLQAKMTLDTYKTLSANWKTQYYLKVTSEYGDPKGEGWYDEGTTAGFSVTSPAGVLIQQVFVSWSGDSTATTAAASLTMNSPKAVIAKWTTDYTQLMALVGAIVVIAAVVFVLRRKR